MAAVQSFREIILTIERAYRICKRDAKKSEELASMERFAFEECKNGPQTQSALLDIVRDVKRWCDGPYLWGKFKGECEFLKHEFQGSYALVHSIILELDKKAPSALSAESRQISKE